jgi:serine/threonine protein kinase
MSNNLTITSSTTLAQLNNFLDDANKSQKILARHDDQGHIVLYAKYKPTTILDRILGRMDRRQERAQQGIQLVFDHFAARNTRTGESGQAGTKALFDHIGQTLSDKAHHGGIRVGDMREMVKATTAVLRALPDGTDAPVSQPRGPSLRTFGMTADAAEISATVRNITGDAKDWDTAAKLGKQMASAFLATNRDPQRQAFAFSGAFALKSELKQALKAATDDMGGKHKLTDGGYEVFAEHAVNQAAALIFPDGLVDVQSTIQGNHKKDVTLPHIEIGGNEYKPSRFLGEGGYADVYEYVRADDPSSKIAFKLSKIAENDGIKEKAAKIEEAAREIEVHQSAYGAGCDQILGMKGAVRLPDGRVGIALEIAPNGTVFDMSLTLRNAIGNGPNKITDAEANILRLTMLKDMARGLEHMHSTQKVTHYDFKSPNCFIGPDGTVKVADFGLSLEKADEHGTTRLDEAGRVDNPYFKAPELMRAEDVRSRLKDLKKETTSVETKQAHAKLKKLLPTAGASVIDALTESVMAPRRDEIREQTLSDRSGLFFGREVDIWGMGAAALELFTGHLPMDHHGFFSQAQRGLEAFGANKNNEPLSDPDQKGRPQEGSIGLRTGNQQIDQFLTDMLRPDPEDRATAKDVINHQIMTTKGIDSPEAKALIVALRGDDPAAIVRARRALANVM